MAVSSSDLETKRATRIKPTRVPTRPSADLPLHRRLFFPTSEPPPLLASETFRSLDAPIYELLALICRAHILPWYGKITRDTRPFLLDVVRLSTHAIRNVEKRIEAADLVQLLAVHLPNVVERHLHDLNIARERAAAVGKSTEEIYDVLHPHPAIRLCSLELPVLPPPKYPLSRAVVSPTYLRNLTETLICLLLPAEDFDAEAERHMTRELIVNVGFATLFYKVGQPWFLHQAIHRVLTKDAEPVGADAPGEEAKWSTPRQFGGAVWALSNRLVALVMAFISVAEALWVMLGQASANKTRSRSYVVLPSFAALKAWLRVDKRAQLSQVALAAEGALFAGGRPLDHLAVHLLFTHALTPQTACRVVETISQSAFPLNGYPAPTPPDPPTSDWPLIHDQVVAALAARLPGFLAKAIGEPSDVVARELLDPLGDHACNVHLFLDLLDTLLAAIFPELARSDE